MQIHFHLRVWCYLALTMCPALAHSQIYKCTSQTDKTIYQGVPCNANSVGQQMNVAASAKQGMAETGLHDEQQILIHVLVLKETCDAIYPGFKEKYAAAWERYRAQHVGEIREAEKSATYKDLNAFVSVGKHANADATKHYVAGRCDGDLLDLMVPLTTPPSDSFSSPERTWATFLAAWKNGNREKMIACLAGETRHIFWQSEAINSPAELRASAAKVEKLTLSGGRGNWLEFVVTSKGEPDGISVVFSRIGENWFIVSW